MIISVSENGNLRAHYTKTTVRAGEVLRLAAVFQDTRRAPVSSGISGVVSGVPEGKSSRSSERDQYAQCLDSHGHELFAPLSARGEFYATCQSGSLDTGSDAVLYRVHQLARRDLPLRVSSSKIFSWKKWIASFVRSSRESQKLATHNNDRVRKFPSIGTAGCRTLADTTATRLQRPDAAGRCNEGSHSIRMRGTSNAREACTKFHGARATRTRCHRANGAPSEKGAIRLPFRSTVAGVAKDATVTFGLQVNIRLATIQLVFFFALYRSFSRLCREYLRRFIDGEFSFKNSRRALDQRATEPRVAPPKPPCSGGQLKELHLKEIKSKPEAKPILQSLKEGLEHIKRTTIRDRSNSRASSNNHHSFLDRISRIAQGGRSRNPAKKSASFTFAVRPEIGMRSERYASLESETNLLQASPSSRQQVQRSVSTSVLEVQTQQDLDPPYSKVRDSLTPLPSTPPSKTEEIYAEICEPTNVSSPEEKPPPPPPPGGKNGTREKDRGYVKLALPQSEVSDLNAGDEEEGIYNTVC